MTIRGNGHYSGVDECYLEVKHNGPRCDKTCVQGFQKSETQTSWLSYRDMLEN